MAEKVKDLDFVELDYTGKLSDGVIFDTTKAEEAKELLFSDKVKFGPVVICVGEKQILPGLDVQLVGREVGQVFIVTLEPEEAFGKRDIKKMKIVPLDVFKEHQLQPRPGLQIDMDGERGLVTRVSGGRIMVNFNHPLAGRKVQYTLLINKIITDPSRKLSAFLSAILRIPEEKITAIVNGEKAVVTLPVEFPLELNQILVQKLMEVTKLRDILIQKESQQEVKESLLGEA